MEEDREFSSEIRKVESSPHLHNRSEFIHGYGGWITIKDLPLYYWSRATFEAIGRHFGGLLEISSKTLNMLDASEAFIKVKPKYCGLIPTTVTIVDEKYGSFEIRASANCLPSSVDSYVSNLDYKTLSNPLDVERFRRISEDEQSDLIRNNLEAEKLQDVEENLIMGIQKDASEGNPNPPTRIEDSTKIGVINEERDSIVEEQGSPLVHAVHSLGK